MNDWLSDTFVTKGEHVYNVMDYGESRDRATVEAAIAAAPAGATLLFPPGVYVGDGQDPHSNPGAFIEITKPLRLVGHGAVFRNLLVYWHGTYDAPAPLAAGMVAGGKDIPVTGHGWAPGEYVQLLSEYDVYTGDAGDLQMGSTNPTTGLRPTCRAAEIHRLMSATTDIARSYDTTRYRYGTDTTGFTAPLPGVTTSEARRINMVDGIRVEGITFDNETSTTARGWVMRACANVSFVDCTWLSGSNLGGFFQCTDMYNLEFIRANTYRKLTTASGASHNTFLIGGGTTGVSFRDLKMHREAQGVDFMPNNLDHPATPGGTDTDIRCVYTTVQDIRVTGGEFRDCSDSVTTHPATWGFLFHGNRAIGGSTGVRSRSRRAHIVGNTLHTARRGVELSSFVDDTVIRGNDLRHTPSPGDPGFWVGVSYLPTSSETVTTNRVRRLEIVGNTMACVTGSGMASAGFSVNHGAARGFTVPVNAKIGLSDITVSSNRFHGCSARVAAWVSGVHITGNEFSGGSDNTHYVLSNPDSTRIYVSGNVFHDDLARGISLGNKFMGEFPADAHNVVGPHVWMKGAPSITPGNNTASATVTQGVN